MMQVCISLALALTAAPLADRTELKGGEKASIVLDDLRAGEYYGVVVSLPQLAMLGEGEAVEVSVEDAKGALVSKTLHAGDPDLTVTIRPRADGAGQVAAVARPAGKTFPLEVRSTRMDLSGKAGILIAANPSADWRSAQPIELGKTVYASADERPFIPLLADPAGGFKDMLAGVQWFTFTWAGPRDVLVHFNIDILDRDVPVDVAVFERQGEAAAAKLVPYTSGIERFVPERSTSFHGLYKFTPRVIRPGTYYVRVMGNHPAYQLRTALYDPPPYQDPRQAVRTAMDYLVKKGDSWHANTPRRGHVALRTTNPLQETSLCIACHPTHFTTRGELVAVENGYPVRERSALQFLTERLYQNPRPLYGFPDTSWVRMISAPGNVMGRLAYMEILFERNVSGEVRNGLLESMGSYLEKYWVDVKAPITESNGNAPRVSGFEIALHSAYVFEELANRTRDPKYLRLREQMDTIASSEDVVDMIDLCWKTVALATLDARKHAKELGALVEKIFSQEREDGSWSVVLDKTLYGYDYRDHKETKSTDFQKDSKNRPISSEFQTWHAIYALAKAGVTDSDPRLMKAIQYCLSRQWSHGGWQGNADYKNFDTPFRDTQFAIMALSELYKGPGSKGWMAGFAPAPATFSARTDDALAALEQYWERPAPATLELIRDSLAHPQALVRQAACAALGRLADAGSAERLAALLGDPSKSVRHAAAWALRQVLNRRGQGEAAVIAAQKSPDDRTREGAMRIFNQHFRYFADRRALSQGVMDSLGDPAVLVRMGAAQALWRWWYWARETEAKDEMEKAVVARLGTPEHPWVRRNLIEGLHNILDENVAYLHNSWIAGVVRQEDKDRISKAWRVNVLGEAGRFREVLLGGNDLQKDGVLRSLYTFHLRESGGDPGPLMSVALPETVEGDWIDGYRRAIAYDPLTQGSGVMAGIGNDHEPPTFYEDSGPLMADAFLAALSSGKEALISGGLKGYRHTAGVPFTTPMAVKILEILIQPGAVAQAEVRIEAAGLLPSRLPHEAPVAAALRDALRTGLVDEIAAAVLKEARNAPLAADPGVQDALVERLLKLEGAEPGAAALIGAAASAKGLDERPEIGAKLLRFLEGSADPAREAALRSLIMSSRLLAAGPVRKKFDEDVAAASGERLTWILKALSRVEWKKVEDEQLLSTALGILSVGLAHPAPDVQRAALESVRAIARIQKNQGILAAVQALSESTDPAVREPAGQLLKSAAPAGGAELKDPRKALDERFFARKVNPILTAVGEDSESCVRCHQNHVIFHLNRPEESADQAAAIRENFLSALKVVDLAKPEESLMLLKPLQTFEKIGVPGQYRNSHGGNVRWKKGRESEEYQTIRDWIQGARLPEDESAAVTPTGGKKDF